MTNKNIIQKIFESHRLNTPEKIAIGQINHDESDKTLTYEALCQKISAATHFLKPFELTQKPVLLSYNNGYDFIVPFLACLSLGILAIPYPKVHKDKKGWIRYKKLIDFIKPNAILTDEQHANSETIHALETQAIDLSTDSIALDEQTAQISLSYCEPKLQTAAYLQFTSGSTSLPKGVQISHDNLHHHMQLMQGFCDTSSNSVIVTWLPYYHDLGLVGQWLHALYFGGSCYALTPVNFIQNPLLWIKALSKYKATITFAPNFAYDLCARKIQTKDIQNISLSYLQVALNGAEPVHENSLVEFYNLFEQKGLSKSALCPAYGLAEATLVVSAKPKGARAKTKHVFKDAVASNRCQFSDKANQDTFSYVSCGKIQGGQGVVIVNGEGQPLAEHQIGEICIHGPSVATGYWKQPEVTKEQFALYTPDDTGPYLKTGDLGFISEGELYLSGRVKDLIIMHGQNYHPNDIEHVVSQIAPAFRHSGTCAFAVEGGVVVIQEVERTYLKKIDYLESAKSIQQSIFHEFQLRVVDVIFIKPMTLPKTTSGKVQRQYCKTCYQENTLDYLFRLKDSEGSDNDISGILSWIHKDLLKVHHPNLADQKRAFSPSLLLGLQAKGLMGIEIPKQYGGLGLSCSEANALYSATAQYDLSLSLFLVLNNTLATYPILQYANEDTKQSLLPSIASGGSLVAFALTEAVAGSNPQAIQTKAVKQGEHWVLNGEKIWSGSAAWAKIITVFAKCYNEQLAFLGIGCFWVQNHSKGITHHSEALTMGLKGMIQNAFSLKNVHIVDGQMISTPQDGLNIAYAAMSQTRMSIGAASLGGMKQCLGYIKSFVPNRQINTGPMLTNDYVRHQITNIYAKIECIEKFINHYAKMLDEQRVVDMSILASIKYLSTTFLHECIDTTMQLMGGRGYIEGNGVEQLMRDARVFRIFEGPSEALLYYIGSHYLACLQQQNLPYTLDGAFEQKRKDLTEGLDEKVIRQNSFYIITLGELISFQLLLKVVESNHKYPIDWISAHTQALWRQLENPPMIASEQALQEGWQSIFEPVITPPVEQAQVELSTNPTSTLTSSKTLEILKGWLIKYYPSHKLGFETEISEVGIDSILAIELTDYINKEFNVDCKPVIFWQCRTLGELAQWIDGKQSIQPPAQSIQQRLFEKLQ